MRGRDLRASSINVGLPFRAEWSVWGGVIERSDRAHAVYLYRGVFDPRRWTQAPEQSEIWAEVSRQSETWTERTQQPESWVEATAQAETWTERTKQTETWTNHPDD